MVGLLSSHARRTGLTAAVLFTAVSQVAMALPANEIHQTFYSGPDFQKQVGTYTLSCSGHPRFTGTESDYMHYVSYPCSRHNVPPVNECLVCPDNNAGDDCIVEACPPVFFEAEHGKLSRSKNLPQ